MYRADAQAGLDPCWSPTHYVGFVVTRLILWQFIYRHMNNKLLEDYGQKYKHYSLAIINMYTFIWLCDLFHQMPPLSRNWRYF
jgi:hypothetical protein